MHSFIARIFALVLIPVIALTPAIAGSPHVASASVPLNMACAGPCPLTKIKHVVIVVQENHTFDNHFGRYCSAPPDSDPACTLGSRCCEGAPKTDPAGADMGVLNDQTNAARDPDHSAQCESEEINGGKMDRFASAACGDPGNVAVADENVVKPYWDLAAAGALADRYFQPTVGASSSNDMYLARAGYEFKDNDDIPKGAIGATCSEPSTTQVEYTDATIGDLLNGARVPWAFYAEGYQQMVDAVKRGTCPKPPASCGSTIYPCIYDPSDVPFQYYPSLREKHMRDLGAFQADLDKGKLPAVAYIKAIGYRTEHPGDGVTLSAGVAFVKGIVAAVMKSQYRADTLVLITWDESGGYFDHVAPPPPSVVDGQPYGPRIPLLAVGPFAKTNYVSHVVMEHSSIVKFIEFNWLGDTGQLGTRDTEVNNIGSLLNPAVTGVPVPEK